MDIAFFYTEQVGDIVTYYITPDMNDFLWFFGVVVFLFIMIWSTVGLVKLFTLRI